MASRSFLMIIFTIGFLHGSSQDTLSWKPGFRLTWNDFRGKPDLRSSFLALSSTGISYRIIYNSNTYQLDAEAFFVKSNSWRKSKADSGLLRHEQAHFDITEIYSRKLVKIKIDLNTETKEFEKIIAEKAQKIIDEKNAFQKLYDQETKYGTDRAKQEEWLEKISILLSNH